MTFRGESVKPGGSGPAVRGVGRAGSLLAGALAVGCAVRGPLFHEGDGVDERIDSLRLHSSAVELHLARRPGSESAPLVLYVTGDGGWRGADPLVYRALVQWGYPAVGMEAHDYLGHLGGRERKATPRHLAADYARVLREARRTLGLPAQGAALLVGFSRGAGLAVLAASQGGFRGRLLGVIAVALTDEEDELSVDSRPEAVNPYRILPRLGALPVAVIQSTRDRYVTAEAARSLFGPDSSSRRLLAIDADGHTFGGAREKLLDSLHSCLRWIAGAPP